MRRRMQKWPLAALFSLVSALLLGACGEGSPTGADDSPETAAGTGSILAVPAEFTANADTASSPPTVLGISLQPRHDGLDEMLDRKIIRVLVGYSQTHYFLDGLTPRGITADSLREFEKFLRRKLKLKSGELTLVPIPVARDQMLEYLAAGLGELAIGNLTITEPRLALADFSLPLAEGIKEVVVTGPGAPSLKSLDDLSGNRLFIRESSSFRESVNALNADLAGRNLEPIEVIPANESLQTEDILELVSAGVVPITIADSHLADFWSGVLPDLVVHADLAVSSNRAIGWAIRRDAAGLKPLVDEFISANRKGTLLGNILFRRYLQDTEYVENAAASEDRQRLLELSALFQRYSSEYTFDWLLIAAQAYQESRLIHATRSAAGAVGVMQILPGTARSPAVDIHNIEELEANVHAGHKYLRHIIDTYFTEPELDEFNRELFAFAAYNAGPTRISRLRRQTAERGLDPNVWFGNVEILVAEQVGREPVQYVRNILKYYTTYSLLRERDELDGTAATD